MNGVCTIISGRGILVKTVVVVMSTYNGEKYIEEQIDSIMKQESVKTILYVRDDNSKDSTVEKINMLKHKYPERIILQSEQNLGYKKSFLKALSDAPEGDYYAFSDQDDVWLKEKCIHAINMIEQKGSNCKLYASAQIMVDENLNQIGYKKFSGMKPSIEASFARHRLPGCTFVFRKEIKEYVSDFADLDLDDDHMPSHDFVITACSLAFGDIIIDDESYIKYRRLNNSLTPGGSGIIKRLKHESKVMFHNRNRYSFTAKCIMDRYSDLISDEKKKFLLHVIKSRRSLGSRLWLIFNRRLNCGVFMGNREVRIKILFGTY